MPSELEKSPWKRIRVDGDGGASRLSCAGVGRGLGCELVNCADEVNPLARWERGEGHVAVGRS